MTPVSSEIAQHLLPGLAAVGGLVEAAVAAGAPQRSLGGDVDDVRVARIDDDLADVLGVLQADVLPADAAVARAVDAVAVADAALGVVLAGAHPHGERVVGVEGQAADRVGALVVEDRRPGDAGVGRLPHAAGGRGDVPGVGRAGSTATSSMRPEASVGPRLRSARPAKVPAERTSFSFSLVVLLGGGLGGVRLLGGERRRRRQQQGEGGEGGEGRWRAPAGRISIGARRFPLGSVMVESMVRPMMRRRRPPGRRPATILIRRRRDRVRARGRRTAPAQRLLH